MVAGTLKPTILIVPGSFSPAFFYHGIIAELNAKGFEAFVYDLPSASRKAPEPAATMADDAALFNEKATRLADEGKDVVLLVHSYGGIVGSECLKGLSRAEREADGKTGGVVKIIYLAAIVPAVGESLRSILGPTKRDYVSFEGDFMYHHDPVASATTSFSDLSQEKGVEMAKQFLHQSTPSFHGQLTCSSYRDVPASYILCEKDLVLPPRLQRSWIELLRKIGRHDVHVLRLDSGHCPNASMPEKVSELVQETIMRLEVGAKL